MNASEMDEKLKSITNLEQLFTENFVAYIYSVDADIKRIFFADKSSRDTNADFLSQYNTELADFAMKYMFRVAAEVTDNGLNRVIKEKGAVQLDLNQWFEQNHKSIGRAALGSCLRRFMPEAFINPEEQAEELYEAGTRPEMIIGLQNYDEKDETHQHARLFLGLLYHLNRDTYNDFCKVLKEAGVGGLVSAFEEFEWLDILKAKMNPDSSIFEEFKSRVREAATKEVFEGTEETSKVVDVSPSGAPIVDRYRIEKYCQSKTVYDWMKASRGASVYLSGEAPDYRERSEKKGAEASAGCVLATTQILMADNGFRRITDIKAYDKIINAKGGRSECSGEVVKNACVRLLYSINEDEPFMSLEHLILTASGYKCIDTKTALELNPRLRIAQLKVGDVVMKYDGEKQIPVVVERINYKENNRELCADIHIADGLKSYITENGYICYANYPEITADSIMKSVSPVSEDFQIFLRENRSTLERTFGGSAYAYVSELASKGGRPVKMESFQADYVSIASMEQADYRIYADGAPGFDRMSLIRGFAFFGEEETPVPLHMEDGEIYWKTPEMTGYLKVYYNGLLLKGHVVRDGKTVDFAAGASVTYDLSYQAEQKEEKLDFGRFEMGYEQREIDGEKMITAVGKWYMPYQDEQGKTAYGTVAATGNMSNPIYYAIDKETHRLYAAAKFPEGIAKLQYEALRRSECTKAKISFSMLFDSITGTGSRYDEKIQDDMVLGQITGNVIREITDRVQKLAAVLGNYLLRTPRAEAVFREKELAALKSAYTRTVEDLARLPVPGDMAEIHSQSFHRTLNMAVYAAFQNQDMSKELLGIPEPVVDDYAGDLTREQAKIAENNHEFLIQKFISAYLSYVYIKRGKSKDCDEKFKKMVQPLLDMDESLAKVYYFMNGNGSKCMTAQMEYSVITNAVYQSVYKNNVIGLDYFYENNREEWAAKLYHRLNQPETLMGLVNMQTLEPENAQLMHYYSMLDVLDSSRRIPFAETAEAAEPEKYSYATVLRKQVINASFMSVMNAIRIPEEGDEEAIETFEEIICQFLKKYIKAIADGTFSKWDAATKTAMENELREMAKEYGFRNVEAMVSEITEVAADIVGEIIVMTDPNISARVFKYFKNHPRASRALTVVFYSLGIIAIGFGSSILAGMNDLEKAEFAITVADIGIQMLADVSVVAAAGIFKRGFGNLTEAENTILKGLSKYDFVEAMAKGKTVQEVLIHLGVNGVADAGMASRFWLRFARIATTIAKGFMLLTVAVSIAVTGYQLFEDIIHGENPGIIALDTLMVLADGVFLVTEAVSCLSASVCAAVPVIGIVAAAVGLVLALVSMSVKRKPPKSPIEIYVKERLQPFVSGLEMPPAAWLDKHPVPENDGIVLRMCFG